MELFAVGLGVVNVVLVVVAIILLVRGRTPSGGGVTMEEFRGELRELYKEIHQDSTEQRREVTEMLARGQSSLGERVDAAATAQADQLTRERDSRTSAERVFRGEVDVQIKQLRADNDEKLTQIRQALDQKLEQVRRTVDEKLRGTLAESLKGNADKVQDLIAGSAKQHVEIQKLLSDELDKLRTSNEAKLETMRATVDEKLQGTLEKRLGESFTVVSKRLEEVQKGLGEMQSLASDVGGLKRVLTNVKSRGTWGEVQLSRQLEDILAPDQYDQNVAIRPGSQERVEFAVKLPGREDGRRPVYLPIDSKFPQEDYERLLAAQEHGDRPAVDAAGAALERAILLQARTISSKYIDPPASTDFAIMYLPTEGLFAEVVSRNGLASRLQNEHRVLVTGPTTLMSLLNSLQMGFRSVAIEKRSSEVWQVLSAAKMEFNKYGSVWDKLGKQLQTAQNTVAEAGRRTRAVERKLRAVETLEPADTVDSADGVPALGADLPGSADVADDEAI